MSALPGRLARLREAMHARGIDLVAIAPTDNLRWLAGFAPLYDERFCALLIGAGDAAMTMPALNAEQTATRLPDVELIRFRDEDGPTAALHATLARVTPAGASPPATFAVDPEMRADHLLELQAALSGVHALDATVLLGPLRAVKDASELERLQRSSDVADRAVDAGFAACVPGATESEVAAAINAVFREAGAEPEFTLVCGGPHSAFPHHETGARPLVAGEPVLLDVGAVLDGYHSDITRMGWVGGEPSARYREVHAIVEGAVAAGLAAARPGAHGGDVDAAARTVIADAGYGEFFVHRTGHGLGVSGHEPPYMMAGDATGLAPGMVFSIEPGIYLPGEFGIRLEEIVHVTDDGCERFSGLDRAVRLV